MTKTEILKKIENLESDLDNLKENLRKCDDDEPKFERVDAEQDYFSIFVGECGVLVNFCCENNDIVDENFFYSNNYFHTKERAKEVATKINFLLKLERLHDIYCPDYEPNWNDPNENKYCIYYNCNAKEYNCIYNHSAVKMAKVYFPTEEIAQKVCDILNEELKNNE